MENNDIAINNTLKTEQFVTLRIDRQLFGLPVAAVEDVLKKQRLTPIPLAHKKIKGLLNLRGKSVVAIDIRTLLQLDTSNAPENYMNIVVHFNNELYSLIVDSVGDVLSLSTDKITSTPDNLPSHWKSISDGVVTLEKELLVLMKVNELLAFTIPQEQEL